MPRKKPTIIAIQSAEIPTEPHIGIYLRVSTEDQAQSGLGLESQLSRSLAMVQVKGWAKPVCIYADEGISGTKDASKRPMLRLLLDDAASGAIQIVIILSLDRLGRKTKLVLDLVEELSNAGVSLISCKESLDTLTPQGQFVLTLFAAVAQLERDMIAQRTTAALAEREIKDGETGGRLPYGYLRQEDSLVIDETTAAIARQIFAWRGQKESLRAIAQRLNLQHISSPQGRVWHASSVREILLNEAAYRGGSRGESAIAFPRLL